MSAESAARQVLEEAIAARIFPAAVAEVGNASGPIWRTVLGSLSFDDEAHRTTEETIFDLASLTKVIATTTMVMHLVQHRRLRLADRIAQFVADWRGDDRANVTVRDLLEHASGLPARLVDAPPGVRREFEHEISATRLEYAPRTQSIYSDLGFILLGFIVESTGGEGLSAQFAAVRGALGIGDALQFGPVRGADIAPTKPLPDDYRKRTLVGEVHDNYAIAMGGVAGHAGLFGPAAAVGAFARLVLRAADGDPVVPPPLTVDAVAEFTRKTDVPGSSRALGWDTMLPTSSCGTHMSARAFGHVGYTGTSLWIDPGRNRYFVLLTNRACDGGTLDQMRDVRRSFHDAWQ